MGCGSCHRLAAAGSTARLGPDLDKRLAAYTPEALRAVIVAPPPSMMPTDFERRMTPRELDALVGWLVKAR
jgi:mono/diheme cytochrome c family protein